jgi:ATP-binding cassette subfamily C protein CydCD
MRSVDQAVRPFLRTARLPLLGVVVAAAVQGVLVVVQAFGVAAAVVAVVDGRSVTTPATVVAAAFVLRAGAGYASDRSAALAATRVSSSVREQVLRAAEERGPVWLGGRRSGGLVTLATRGASAVEPYLTRYLPALVAAATLPFLTVAAMATQDLLATAVVLATLPLLPLFAALIGMTTKARADRQWRALATLAGHFLDVVRGLPTLVAFRRARAQTEAIRSATDRHRRATLATLRLAFASSAALELIATLSVALVAVCVGLRLDAGQIDLRSALTVLLLAPEAYWPIRKVGAEFHAAAEGAATFAAVTDLVGGRFQLDPAESHGAASTSPRALPSSITLRGVEIRYPGAAGEALVLPDAEFLRGRLNVVVGRSGAGKSTLLMALLGFVDLEAGAIRVDGSLIDRLDPDWRRQIAWVPQRPWFAPGSIGDNLRLARPAASDSDLWCALTTVGMAEVVAALPGGLESDLAEDGRSLSAGQRSRIALARTIVADRQIVLLDEPTAHLDPRSQRDIADVLKSIAESALVVVVSHRDELVSAADAVIAVDAVGRWSTRADARRPRPSHPFAPTAAPSPPSHRPAQSIADRVPDRLRLTLAMLLGALAGGCGVALTATSGWLIVRASERPPVLTLLVAIVGVRAFGLGRPLFRYAERLVAHDAALRRLADARVQVYRALIPLTPGRLGRRRGDLLASVVDDVDSVVDRPIRVWLPTTSALAVGLAACAGAWTVSASVGVVIAALVGVGGCAFVVATTAHRRLGAAAVAARADLAVAVADEVDGAGELAVWRPSGRSRRVLDADRRLAGIELRAANRVASARCILVLGVGAAAVAVAAVAARLVEAGSTSPAVAALLVLLPLGLAELLAPLPEAGALAPRTHAALDRIRRLEHTEPAVTEAAEPVDSYEHDGLRASDVAAGWEAGDVLSGVSLDLRPGQHTAVVGPSGSGKSTLIAILARNIDPRSGSVTLGGTDVRDLRLDAVRSVIGQVDDDPHIFGSSIFENVRLARPGASRDEVLDALRRVRLDEWVDSLPLGLDTLVGDGGFDVSGGERARIALARAVLANPSVLVLDEPTAHLDSATATDVLDHIVDAWAGRSLAVSTHRLDDLARFDEIVALA